MKFYARIGYIGIMFPVSIFVGYLIGNWLDEKMKTSPVLTLIFIGFGFAAAIRTLLSELKKLEEEE